MRASSLLVPLVCLAACASSSKPPDTIGSKPGGATPPSQSATVIAALPGAATSEWDDAVKAELLRAYDSNHSGKIDTVAELRGVPCDVWFALDHAVSTSEQYPGDGVAVIYGFTTDKLWVGYAFAIAGKLRPVAADTVGRCGIELTGPTGYEPSIDYDALPVSEDDRERENGGEDEEY